MPRLLLVDDDDLVRATFGKELADRGFEVLLADSGKRGLDIASETLPIDLAILDIRMPEMSGLELAKHLSGLGVPWIFLSAYDDSETVTLATEQGAMGYLVKPIDTSQAIPTIFSAIKRSKEINELVKAESRLSGALETGNLVNVAVGLLMERQKLEKDVAFELIRKKARDQQRKIKDVAQEILSAWEKINMK